MKYDNYYTYCKVQDKSNPKFIAEEYQRLDEIVNDYECRITVFSSNGMKVPEELMKKYKEYCRKFADLKQYMFDEGWLFE